MHCPYTWILLHMGALSVFIAILLLVHQHYKRVADGPDRLLQSPYGHEMWVLCLLFFSIVLFISAHITEHA